MHSIEDARGWPSPLQLGITSPIRGIYSAAFLPHLVGLRNIASVVLSGYQLRRTSHLTSIYVLLWISSGGVGLRRRARTAELERQRGLHDLPALHL